MKIMSWNCQGLGNPRTVRALQKLIAANHPDIIFLMETKKHNINKQFQAKFAASYSFFSIDCTVNGVKGKSGGLILLWNNCTCHVDINDTALNYIDMTVTNIPNTIQWRATCLYGYSQHHNKHQTCTLINNLKNSQHNTKWLLFGDLNLTLCDKEKYGGNPLDNTITSMFTSTLNLFDLQDLGYNGDIFTWMNNQEEPHLIKARLDRFLATSEWINSFPNFSNSHLLRYKSDHAPILLEFSLSSGQTHKRDYHKPRRYEQVWTRDENHCNIVKTAWATHGGTTNHKLMYTLNSLHRWGQQRFGVIPKRIKAAQIELQHLNEQNGPDNFKQQIKNKEKELDDLLESEELWWGQRSRALWL
jgi:exonuclease III